MTVRTVEFSKDVVAEQVHREVPSDQKIIAINLLKYRPTALYATNATETTCSGEEAYKKRYMVGAMEAIQEGNIASKIIYQGRLATHLIGPQEERWDECLIVEYHSKEEFVRLMRHPKWSEGSHHRTAALEDSRLWLSIES